MISLFDSLFIDNSVIICFPHIRRKLLNKFSYDDDDPDDVWDTIDDVQNKKEDSNQSSSDARQPLNSLTPPIRKRTKSANYGHPHQFPMLIVPHAHMQNAEA